MESYEPRRNRASVRMETRTEMTVPDDRPGGPRGWEGFGGRRAGGGIRARIVPRYELGAFLSRATPAEG